jgi:dipeptidyl aminopeptidase/acylaminoacyl peptidase
VLTGDFDRSAGKFAVSGDSSTVYFTAEGEGNETLYRVPLAGGRVEPVGVLADGCTTSVDVGKGATVAVWERASNPPEIVEIDVEKKQHRLLSNFNAARVAQLDLPQVEHVWFTSAKGRRIHSILVKPPGFDPSKKYPLFVMLHGGPHTMARDAFSARWNYHFLSAPGYVFLMPNFTGSTGFGEAFSQAIQRDPLRTPAEEINQAADEAVKQFPFIDRERIAAGGASYGGHLANWLQATTARYRCLISHAGLVNLEAQWGTSDVVYSREVNNGGPIWEQSPVWREQNPIRYAGNHATKTGWITPMLLTVGEQDFRVPLNNTLENWTYHQRLKIPSRLLVFPDENHWILKGENSKYWYGEIHGWLSRWLRAQ